MENESKRTPNFTANLVNLGLGCSILVFGYKTPSLVILISALKVSGMAGLKQNVKAVTNFFTEATTAINDAKPEIEAELKMIAELEKELKALYTKYQNKEINENIFAKEKSRIQQDLGKLREIVGKVEKTLQTVSSKIDWKSLQAATQQIYAAMTAVIASHSFPNAKVLSNGLGLGSQISDFIYKAVRNYRSSAAQTQSVGQATQTPEETERADEQLRTLAKVTGTVSGLLVAFAYRKLSSLVTACSIGSEMVLSSLAELTDPYLINNNLPTLTSQVVLTTALQGILFTYGFMQFRHHSSIVENILLSPLLVAEGLLGAVLLYARYMEAQDQQ